MLVRQPEDTLCSSGSGSGHSVHGGGAGEPLVLIHGFSGTRLIWEPVLEALERVSFLDGTDAAGLSHAELEERLDRDGRELLRRLLDDHLALRAVREQRLEQVVGDEGVARGRVESGHARTLETVFGPGLSRAAGVAGARPGEPASRRRGPELAGGASLARAAQAGRAGGWARQLPGCGGRDLAIDGAAAR